MNAVTRPDSRAPTQQDSPWVLILGNRRQSLTVIRSLASKGYQVVVGVNRGDNRDYHAHRSRWAAKAWVHDDWRDSRSQFLEQLKQLLKQHPHITTVFPIDESSIRCIDAIRGDFPDEICFVTANPHSIRTCMDKHAMFEICREQDISFANFEIVEDCEKLEPAIRSVGLPCVIKPLDNETIWFGKKALILRDDNDLTELSRVDSPSGKRMMVQRCIDGPRHNVYFAAHQGQLIDAAEVKVFRTDRVDGTGLAVSGSTIEPTEVLHVCTKKLITKLNYNGVGCAQFLLDETSGDYCFLELNPRLGANFAVVDQAGLDLANIAIQLAGAGGSPPNTIGQPYRRGLRFAWTFGAMAGCRFELSQKDIGLAGALNAVSISLLEAVRANSHITFSYKDPLPTILEFTRAMTGRSTLPSKTKQLKVDESAG